jgi:hypothetical protein
MHTAEGENRREVKTVGDMARQFQELLGKEVKNWIYQLTGVVPFKLAPLAATQETISLYHIWNYFWNAFSHYHFQRCVTYTAPPPLTQNASLSDMFSWLCTGISCVETNWENREATTSDIPVSAL